MTFVILGQFALNIILWGAIGVSREMHLELFKRVEDLENK